MNQLTNVTIDVSTIQNSFIREANGLHVSNYANVQLPGDVTLLIGDYRISASDLVIKLQLLDKLIAQYLPEELI
ncbi:MAG: hypothetical protein ACYDD5_00795 [Sulfuricurvum sp.]